MTAQGGRHTACRSWLVSSGPIPLGGIVFALGEVSMRRLRGFVLLVLFCHTPAFPAPGDVSLTRPMVVSPKTQLGNATLQSRYDDLWKAYQAKTDEGFVAVEAELVRLYEVAKTAGNLDLAIYWGEMKDALVNQGRLIWEPIKQKKDWKKRFGEADFPESLTAVVRKCEGAVDEAKAILEAGYKEIEVELTKADELKEAIAIRNEFKGLWSVISPQPVIPMKPEAIDLLRQVNLDSAKGWKRNAGVYVGTARDGFLQASLTEPADYDLVAEFRLQNTMDTTGWTGIDLGLPLVEGSPHIALSGKREGGPSKGSFVYFPKASTGEKQAPLTGKIDGGMKPNEWHTLIVQVRKADGSVTVTLDGKETLKATPFPGLQKTTTVTIGANTTDTEIAIRKWEVRPVR